MKVVDSDENDALRNSHPLHSIRKSILALSRKSCIGEPGEEDLFHLYLPMDQHGMVIQGI